MGKSQSKLQISDSFKSQSNHDKLESNPNQVTRFQIKSSCSQIKSLDVIQSWFQSNQDLDLPVTDVQIKQI